VHTDPETPLAATAPVDHQGRLLALDLFEARDGAQD
jgi:hypothetical protein